MTNNLYSRREILKQTALLTGLGFIGNISQDFAAFDFKRAPATKVKISLNVYSFNQALRDQQISLDEILEFCGQTGFEAIDPTGYYFPGYPAVPDDNFINNFKRAAFLQGLDISGTGVRNDFSTPDRNQRMADIDLVKKWIECAAKLGAPMLRIFTGRGIPDGYQWAEVAEWMAADITQCLEHTKKFGVMLAIQNHYDFIKTADELLQLLKMINSEWLGVMVDIASFRTTDPYEDTARVTPYALSWQIKEQIYIQGKNIPVDLSKLMKIIKSSGYRGYILIETLGIANPKQRIPEFLKMVQNALISEK